MKMKVCANVNSKVKGWTPSWFNYRSALFTSSSNIIGHIQPQPHYTCIHTHTQIAFSPSSIQFYGLRQPYNLSLCPQMEKCNPCDRLPKNNKPLEIYTHIHPALSPSLRQWDRNNQTQRLLTRTTFPLLRKPEKARKVFFPYFFFCVLRKFQPFIFSGNIAISSSCTLLASLDTKDHTY